MCKLFQIGLSAFLLLLAGKTPTAWAQKGVKGGFEVGVRVGPNLAFLTGVLPKEEEFRRATTGVAPRFSLGVMVAYLSRKKPLGLETGLYFNQSAFTINSQAALDSINVRKLGQTFEYEIQSIHLPVLLRVNLPISKSLVAHVTLGPRMGFLIAANRQRRFEDNDTARAYGLQPGRSNQYQNINFFDVAACLGGGIYYSITSKWYVGGGLRLEYSFIRTFSDIIRNNTQIITGGGNLVHLHLQGGVTYRF